jgi:hypothetical protein
MVRAAGQRLAKLRLGLFGLSLPQQRLGEMLAERNVIGRKAQGLSERSKWIRARHGSFADGQGDVENKILRSPRGGVKLLAARA